MEHEGYSQLANSKVGHEVMHIELGVHVNF